MFSWFANLLAARSPKATARRVAIYQRRAELVAAKRAYRAARKGA